MKKILLIIIISATFSLHANENPKEKKNSKICNGKYSKRLCKLLQLLQGSS